MNPNDPRQPAYDAVFEEIRRQGHDAAINAFAWRCVNAALNAANVGIPVDPRTGQRFADEPRGLIEDVEISDEELQQFKDRWNHPHPQTIFALWFGAEVDGEQQ